MDDKAAALKTKLRDLSRAEYAIARAELAKEFALPLGQLDKVYGDPEARKTPPPPEPESWPDPVDGNGLLSALVNHIGRYVFAEPLEILAVSLWVLHTHAHESFDVSPILLISSPVKGCGKSTLLDVLEILVPRPMLSANCSAAALYRSTENRPTVLCDEGDLYLSEDKSLVAFFNAGHRRGVPFQRCEGDDHHVVSFDSWCPKAIAQIGMPRWPTIVDRSFVIRLRRKLAGEPIEKFRKSRIDPDIEDLRAMAARWAEDHADDLRGLDPTMPATLDNRAEDNWAPLFAIAETVGGEWPAELSKAVKALARDDEDRRIELLADLRTICEATEAEFLSTTGIVESLLEMAERPYSTINRNRPITVHWLGRQLRAFDVKSDRWRPVNGSGTQLRGYHVAAFKEVWERYLPTPRPLPLNDSSVSSGTDETVVTGESDKGREEGIYTEEQIEVPF